MMTYFVDALESGAFARSLIDRSCARVRFEWRRGGADGTAWTPAVATGVDFGTEGTVDFARREIVGRGTALGLSSCYIGATWYPWNDETGRFGAHGRPEHAPLQISDPLWILLALTAGTVEPTVLGTQTLRELVVRRHALRIPLSAVSGIAHELNIAPPADARRTPLGDVPAEVWADEQVAVVRLACTFPPRLRRRWLDSRAAKSVWFTTDLWDFGVTPKPLPPALAATPPDADFREFAMPDRASSPPGSEP